MWNEHIRPLRDDSLFWHRVWKDAGSPATGALAAIMRNTRAKYHRAVKLHKRDADSFRRAMIANSISNGDSRNLWKELKKLDSARKITPCTVNGFSDNSDIADTFAEKYQNLYTSVPTDASDLTALRQSISDDISLFNPSDIVEITVNDISKAISQLKYQKSDGIRGTDSDHFIHGSHKFKVMISLMVHSMFTHGHTPNDLLESVLTSIPKDIRGNLCADDNYRGIALCSAICKVIDIVIINKYSDKLMTSELQFAYKSQHSTSMCTTVLKEVCSYYQAKHTDVYVCMLDASKAFDRVHYGKLFSLLRQRKVPPMVTRLLLDMYTRQRMRTVWNGATSASFSVDNGVRQGGILSPILFCVYVDELLNRINKSGLGCHIGHISYSGLGYADDVSILTPSVHAMQSLIHICEDFAKEYNVIFNAKKTMCMRIGNNGNPPARVLTLYGVPLTWNRSVKHLGNVITCDLKDNDDIRFKKGIFISQVNKLNYKMSAVSGNVKGRLLQTYCCSWYGCQTWDLFSKSVKQMTIEWNKAVRRTLNIPYTSHTCLLPLLVKGKPFDAQHMTRVSKFVGSFINSQNEHLQFLGEMARHNSIGALGRNYTRCRAVTDSVPPEPDLVVTAQAVRELLDVRDGVMDMPGFDIVELNTAINDLCSK